MHSTSNVNRQRHREQQAAFAQGELERQHRHEQMIRNVEHSEDKSRHKRYNAQRYAEEQEEARIISIIEAEREKTARVEREEREEAIAAELKRLKLVKLRDEKMRQQIRLESSELRELESKLNAAYMTKEREAQVREKEMTSRRELDEELYRQAQTERELEASHRAAADSERAKLEAAKALKADIEEQMIEKEKEKEFAYQQFMKEKLMIDEVVRKIYEEDAKVRQIEMEKKMEQRAYIEQFQMEQQHWQAVEKARIEAEAQNIKQYATQQEKRATERQIKRKEANQALEQAQASLAAELDAAQKQKDEYDRIIQDVVLAEQDEKERAKEAAKFEKELRMKLELQRNHAQQMEHNEQRRAMEQAELEQYRRQMMEKLAEDDRIEQMNANKRRMKQLEHKRAVEQLLTARQAQFEAAKEREIIDRKAEMEQAARRAALIEEERQKLLAKHAHNLLGYIPKGVLKDEDIARLGNEFADKYKNRDDFEAKYFM